MKPGANLWSRVLIYNRPTRERCSVMTYLLNMFTTPRKLLTFCILMYPPSLNLKLSSQIPNSSDLTPVNYSIWGSGSQPGGNFPLGENFALPGGKFWWCWKYKYCSQLNIALINIHVSLIFLNNSWNHSTDKSKSQYCRFSQQNIE